MHGVGGCVTLSLIAVGERSYTSINKSLLSLASLVRCTHAATFFRSHFQIFPTVTFRRVWPTIITTDLSSGHFLGVFFKFRTRIQVGPPLATVTMTTNRVILRLVEWFRIAEARQKKTSFQLVANRWRNFDSCQTGKKGLNLGDPRCNLTRYKLMSACRK